MAAAIAARRGPGPWPRVATDAPTSATPRSGALYQRIHTGMDLSPASQVDASAVISRPTTPRRSAHGARLKNSHHATTAAPPTSPPRTRTRNWVEAAASMTGAANLDSQTAATMATPGQIRRGLELIP